MTSSQTHYCPRCNGAVNAEHYARVRAGDGFTEEYLYCEFCERGWERAIDFDGDVFSVGYVHHTEPDNFAAFLRRLEEATAA